MFTYSVFSIFKYMRIFSIADLPSLSTDAPYTKLSLTRDEIVQALFKCYSNEDILEQKLMMEYI